MAVPLTGRTPLDQVQVLRDGTTGVDVAVVDAVQVEVDQWDQSRELSRL